MNILIVAKSGSGKSNLADLIKNAIFKSDEDSKIVVDDPDRENKTLGDGNNEYLINVRQEATKQEIEESDIMVEIKNKKFIEKFREIF